MNPFSPFFYLKNNLARTVSLVFVMSMSAICYLIGLYATNPYDENLRTIEYYKDFAVVAPVDEDISREQFGQFLSDAANYADAGHIINADYYIDSSTAGSLLFSNYKSGIRFYTVLYMQTFIPFPIISNLDDFKQLSQVLGIPDANGDRNIVMSAKLARHIDKETGDIVSNDWDSVFGLKNDLLLTNTFENSTFGVQGAYSYFCMDSDFAPQDAADPRAVIFLREAAPDVQSFSEKRSEFASMIREYRRLYPRLLFIDYDYNLNIINNQYTPVWLYFWAVLAVIGTTIILTTVGIFSVALEKRDYEFGVYKAIGFSRRRVLMKGAAEVFLLQLMSIVIGVAAIFITVSSINDLLLFKGGQELYYYSDMALLSYVICNAATTIILLIMKSSRILRSDVVDY